MNHLSLRTDEDVDYILEQYSDTVYKVAFSNTRDKYHAEDVFQEVFLRLVKKKPYNKTCIYVIFFYTFL